MQARDHGVGLLCLKTLETHQVASFDRKTCHFVNLCYISVIGVILWGGGPDPRFVEVGDGTSTF